MVDEQAVNRGLGGRIRERREWLGISLRDFASSIKMTASSVSMIERGKQALRCGQIYMIAEHLDVPPVQLFQGLPTQIENHPEDSNAVPVG